MDKDRLVVILYNAIIMLQEQGFTHYEILEELRMTEEEFEYIGVNDIDYSELEDEYFDEDFED